MSSLHPDSPAVHRAAPAAAWPFPDVYSDECPELPDSAYHDALDLDDAVVDEDLAGEAEWYGRAHNEFLP